MLLDGSEMDSFADLTHTPQGDVKTRIARGILMVSDLTHTPQGDVKNEAMFSLLPKFKNLTHTPQGDGSQLNADPVGLVVAANQLTPRKGTEISFSCGILTTIIESTHTPQGDGDNLQNVSS